MGDIHPCPPSAYNTDGVESSRNVARYPEAMGKEARNEEVTLRGCPKMIAVLCEIRTRVLMLLYLCYIFN